MPDTNDYLSQLLNRVDKKLSESQGESSSSPSSSSSGTVEPIRPKVFTSNGRFDSVPSGRDTSAEERPAPAPAPQAAEPEPEQPRVTRTEQAVPSPEPPAAPVIAAVPLPGKPEEVEDDEDDEEGNTLDYEEDLPFNNTRTDEKTFSLSADNEVQAQPSEAQTKEQAEDVFNWNVSEDVEKYLSSGDGGSIFERAPRRPEKKSLKARMAERRKLKENTKQLMDRNSGAKRGCFGTFFHLVFLLLLVALTILAVLYVLQTIAEVTIIDVDSIIAQALEWLNKVITPILAKFKK